VSLPRIPRISSLLRSIVPVVLTLTAGCGGGDTDPGGIPLLGTYERLEWSSQAHLPQGETTVLRTFEPEEHLSGSGVVSRDFEGPFPARSFNQIALTLLSPEPNDVGVGVLRGGKLVRNSGVLRVPPRKAEQTVVFDLPRMRRDSVAADGLRVAFIDLSGEVRLVRVELRDRPDTDWLPDPAGPPALVTVGLEGHRAIGLSSEQTFTAHFESESERSLVFSVGIPDAVYSPGEKRTVELAIRGPRGREVKDITIEPERWQTVRIPLAPYGQGEGSATIRLKCDEGESGTVALGVPAITGPEPRAQSVLLVTSDTHRADHIGATGGLVRTPALDALAARGVLFDDCFSSANNTNPSHVAILTGLHPRDTGVVNNYTALADEATTLAENYAAAGYATWATLSAAHLENAHSGLGQGFDRMTAQGVSQRDSEEAIRAVEAWLDEFPDVPVFIWLHSFDAHAPYETPPEYDRMYYPEERDPYDANLPALPEREYLAWNREVRDLEYIEALYKSEVTYFDDQLAGLFARPRLAAGIIAVTGDHGESMRAHDVYFDHRELYPDSLHVPLILCWPDAPAATRIERAIRQIDLGRTLLDLSGLERAPFPGTNLLGAELGPVPRFSISARAQSVSLEHERWFCVLHLEEHKANQKGETIPRHSLELYDLMSDPGCTQNLATADPERAKRYRASLVAWLSDSDAEELAAEDAGVEDVATLDAMAGLGYGDSQGRIARSDWFDPACECSFCAEFD